MQAGNDMRGGGNRGGIWAATDQGVFSTPNGTERRPCVPRLCNAATESEGSGRCALAAAWKIYPKRVKTCREQIGIVGGRRPKDDRLVLSRIVFVRRTCLPWRDVPAYFGTWGTICTRFRRWCASGLFAQTLRVLSRRAQGMLRHLDCSHIKLHQHGATPTGGQQAQAMGHFKGGLNTKLARVVDRYGRAVALSLAAGPRHDLYAIEPLLASARHPRIVADKGFDADSFRQRLRGQRTRCCIPPKRGRRHPARFHRGYYRSRFHVENFFQRIKTLRRVSTRYEKFATTFLAFVQHAAVLDWLLHRV